MKIAFLHHHLNRGGVTQVIANQVAALASLDSDCPIERIGIFHGGRRTGWSVDELATRPFALTLHEVAGLDYDAQGTLSAVELARRTATALASAGFSPADTVLHVHNPSLGKNVVWPAALARLAADGFTLLLQIHDFAEDFRPQNYGQIARDRGTTDPGAIAASLYPQAPHIHYAVLNRRDQRVLAQAQIAAERLHLLPNPVASFGRLPEQADARRKLADQFGIAPDRPFVLYPVRGIRRKNLGEALLWSAAARDRADFGLTLAPLNPVERPSYDRWKEVAAEFHLPFHFELGGPGGLAFTENLAAADQLLTTSVAEGFGMVFLEAWLAGRQLIGRDLPEITADFVEHGLQLPDLHAGLVVPVSWLGWERFADAFADAYLAIYPLFGRPQPARTDVLAELAELVDDSIDFAQLPSALQREVIGRVATEPSAREELFDRNPWMPAALDRNRSNDTLIAENATVVGREYSLARSADRLLETYRVAASSPRSTTVGSPGRGEAILAEFLSLKRFQPVRTEA